MSMKNKQVVPKQMINSIQKPINKISQSVDNTDIKNMTYPQLISFFRTNFKEKCVFMYESRGHNRFFCDYKVIKDCFTTWVDNRNIDSEVTKRISDDYLFKSNYIDFTFHLAFIDDVKELKCYDGNHRRCALDIIMDYNKENKKDESIWITFDLKFEKTEIDVRHEFININKAVPVSENCLNGRVQIDKEIDALVETYHNHKLYTTYNVKRPFFNKSMLKSTIVEIEKYYNYDLSEPQLSINNINKALCNLNIFYSNYRDNTIESKFKLNPVFKGEHRKPPTPLMIEKCETNNFWLFLCGKININDLKFVIEQGYI